MDTQRHQSDVRHFLFNRGVGVVFGLLVSFLIVLWGIFVLELDPFGNLVVRLLLLPGYVIMLSYVILGLNLLPETGRVGWLIGLGLYLYLLSVVIAGLHQSLSDLVSRLRS